MILPENDMPRLARKIAFLALILTAPLALADNECDYTASRQASIDVEGAALIEIEARAGSLVVEGHAGLSQVDASGQACSSDRDRLEKIRLVTKRSGDRVRVIAKVPDARGWGWGSSISRLDLLIEVPSEVPLKIADSSGSIDLRNVGSTELEDSSGSIEVRGLVGDLRIEDSSGEIEVREVAGDVYVEDSSGEIDVRGVEGSVVVEDDSSGGIFISDVARSVLIHEDSSGSIRVDNVGGDFIVERGGSGSIDYRRVSGRVEVPSRKR